MKSHKKCVFAVLLTYLFLAAMTGWVQAGTSAAISYDGGEISADKEHGFLTLRHNGLGMVLQDMRLNLGSGHALEHLKGCSVERAGDNKLRSRTSRPRSTWRFPGVGLDTVYDTVNISTTNAARA